MTPDAMSEGMLHPGQGSVKVKIAVYLIHFLVASIRSVNRGQFRLCLLNMLWARAVLSAAVPVLQRASLNFVHEYSAGLLPLSLKYGSAELLRAYVTDHV